MFSAYLLAPYVKVHVSVSCFHVSALTQVMFCCQLNVLFPLQLFSNPATTDIYIIDFIYPFIDIQIIYAAAGSAMRLL